LSYAHTKFGMILRTQHLDIIPQNKPEKFA